MAFSAASYSHLGMNEFASSTRSRIASVLFIYEIFLLAVAQRGHWLDRGGAPCRNVAGSERDDKKERRSKHKCHRIDCFYPKEHRAQQARKPGGAGNAEDNAAQRKAKPLTQYQRENAAALRAQRLPDGDLARAFHDGIRNHAVQPKHSEQRSDEGERAEEREHQAALGFRGIEDCGERLDVGDRLIVIQRQHLPAYRRSKARGI